MIKRCNIIPNETVPVTPVINRTGYDIVRANKALRVVYLPNWESLVAAGVSVSALRTTDSWFEIIFVIGDVEHKFVFNEQWLTDLASVPPLLRSFVDNDAPWIIPAAMVHDALVCHRGFGVLSFKQSNRFFYELCKCYVRKQYPGKRWPLVQCWLAFASVSLPFVYRKYWNKDRASFEKKGVRYERRVIG